MYARDGNGDTPLGLSLRSKNPLKNLTQEEIEVLEFTEMSKDDLMTPPGNLLFFYVYTITLMFLFCYYRSNVSAKKFCRWPRTRWWARPLSLHFYCICM